MLSGLNDNQRGLSVALIIFLTTISNYFFNEGSFVASCFCISIGFALGFYFYFGNKLLPYLFGSILFSNIISRILFFDESFGINLSKSLGFSIISLLVIYIMKNLTELFGSKDKIGFKSGTIFILGSIAVSVLAGVLITTLMMVNDAPGTIYEIFIKWSTGYFFGIIIFGSTVLFSYHYEGKTNRSFRDNILGVIFILVFILVTSVLFSGTVSWFTFDDYAYVFIIFYLTLAFVFSYRMILLIDILFVVLYQLFFIKLGDDIDYLYLIFSINLYLLVLSTTASSVKMVLFELVKKNKALIKSSQKLESLVYSTESLLKLSDDILNTDVKVQEDYLSRIFKIACNIFDNYDFAACYIKGDPYVNFVDAVGYDPKVLTDFKFESSKLGYIDVNNPVHIVNGDTSVRRTLESKYEAFSKIYPQMNESIRFGISIDKENIGGISFDISKGSGKKFMIEEFKNLKSFQKLMNSFFSINYLNYKNISLKNDIVLSLIRTLELFDQYTGGHSEEVAYLSNEIAKRCELNEFEMHDIYWAGVVHDIGKVGVDNKIINKPSKLSLEEYEEIKKHSIFGYEILNKAEDLKC